MHRATSTLPVLKHGATIEGRSATEEDLAALLDRPYSNVVLNCDFASQGGIQSARLSHAIATGWN